MNKLWQLWLNWQQYNALLEFTICGNEDLSAVICCELAAACYFIILKSYLLHNGYTVNQS